MSGQGLEGTALDVLALAPHYIAINKPAGLHSVPGIGPCGELAHGSLLQQVQARWPEAKLVHRLDMATSGMMLFARGDAAQRQLARLFERRQMRKHYIAVVHGRVVGEAGLIDAAIGADWPQRPLQRLGGPAARAARTHWRLMAREGACTRLALAPDTGRTHQLRLHLSSIGHPIVGDALYGSAEDSAAPRLMLHAHSLSWLNEGEPTPNTLVAPCPF